MPKDKTSSVSKGGSDKLSRTGRTVSDTIDTATPEELAVIDKEMSQLQSQIEESKTRSKRLTSELSVLTSALPTDQMFNKLNQLIQKNDQSRQLLSQLSTGAVLVSAEEKQHVGKETDMYRRKWLERRRMFKDMFATVTENLPGKPKDLLDELDIDVHDPFDLNINPRELVQS
ncbi:hypothetical protein BGZ76_010801 [Entomortierella beljakovae]|nr:hypothetical protein BGZ76_010801 [Entomortierella beljakovae]